MSVVETSVRGIGEFCPCGVIPNEVHIALLGVTSVRDMVAEARVIRLLAPKEGGIWSVCHVCRVTLVFASKSITSWCVLVRGPR